MEKTAQDTQNKQCERQVCQNCTKYSRKTKKCSITGNYVARKSTCDKYSETR